MSSEFQLRQVEFIPKILEEAGILYVSERFKVAAHLCPCGCATKIITPLGPCEWSLSIKGGKPTIDPSIGNWQLPCRSHYWIINGVVEWSYPWSDRQIEVGRKAEENRRRKHYNKPNRKRWGTIVFRFFNRLFKKPA